MKIRIVQAGFETYSGEMGHIQFEQGVSVSDNPHPDFVRALGTVLKIEEVPPEPAADPEGDAE